MGTVVGVFCRLTPTMTPAVRLDVYDDEFREVHWKPPFILNLPEGIIASGAAGVCHPNG